MLKRRLLLLCTVAALGGWGPFLLLPGGELDGTVSPPPDDWSVTDPIKTVQLETRPSDPYSVNIWVVALDGMAYVHAGANRAAWVEHIEADTRVRLRVGETIYELTAERVTDAAEFERFSDAYEAKYDRRPRNENVNEAYLFRLSART